MLKSSTNLYHFIFSASAMTDTTISTSASYPCPRCQTPTTWTDNPYKPFCSERCKLIDLGAWASESYSIPAEDAPFSSDTDGMDSAFH